MSRIPCPHCGVGISQSRPDGRCVACGKPLAQTPRDPQEPSAKPAPDPGVLQPGQAFSAYYDRGIGHLKKREYPQAIAEFTHAIGLDPSAPNPYVGRALAYRAAGDEANAARDESKAKNLGGPEGSSWDRLVNRAYRRLQGDLRDATRDEFYHCIHPLQRTAVQLRELNRQVHNGGFPQWVLNGYGAWIDELMNDVEQIGTNAAREVRTILEGVSALINPGPLTEEADEENLTRLLQYTDQYYAVMGRFGQDVESWIEEQSQHPERPLA
jgi:hypothetical protein